MFDQFIAALTSPEVGGLMVTLSALMLADFVTGVGAAIRRGIFEPLLVGEFLRTHVLGRLVPILGLIFLAVLAEPLVVVLGLGVAAYTTETVASIKANLDLATEASPAD